MEKGCEGCLRPLLGFELELPDLNLSLFFLRLCFEGTAFCLGRAQQSCVRRCPIH